MNENGLRNLNETMQSKPQTGLDGVKAVVVVLPGTGDEPLSVLQMFEDKAMAVIVTSPQATALAFKNIITSVLEALEAKPAVTA